MYMSTYGVSFTDSLVKCKETSLQNRQTATEKTNIKCRVQRECRDHINEQLVRYDAITVLSEAQSLSSYQRLPLSQSFESPEQTLNRAENAVTKLKKHSALGREFNIPNKIRVR